MPACLITSLVLLLVVETQKRVGKTIPPFSLFSPPLLLVPSPSSTPILPFMPTPPTIPPFHLLLTRALGFIPENV